MPLTNTLSDIFKSQNLYFRSHICKLSLVLFSYLAHSACFLLLDSIGGESLAVAQNTYAVNWFKGKELNLVFGLQLSMARLVWTQERFIYTKHVSPMQ